MRPTEGGRLFDVDGRSYLDFGAAWAPAGLGFSNERVRTAVNAELDRMTFGGLVSGINRPAIELAERLIDLVPRKWEKPGALLVYGPRIDAAAPDREPPPPATQALVLVGDRDLASWMRGADAIWEWPAPFPASTIVRRTHQGEFFTVINLSIHSVGSSVESRLDGSATWS